MTLNLLHVKNLNIFQQLKLEEALLRLDKRNFCIINEGSSKSLVMGISGKPDKLLNVSLVKQDKVPLIKRFSGGGAVIVDEDTLFVSFIFNKKRLKITPFPEPILRWSETFYKKAFSLKSFHLRENDYVIDKHKCGGNAQYIQKDRWLHHTTFLWDFKNLNMEYLLLPPKSPSYRKERGHLDFLCRLKDFFPSKTFVVNSIKNQLHKDFEVEDVSLKNLKYLCDKTHRKSTTYLYMS